MVGAVVASKEERLKESVVWNFVNEKVREILVSVVIMQCMTEHKLESTTQLKKHWLYDDIVLPMLK